MMPRTFLLLVLLAFAPPSWAGELRPFVRGSMASITADRGPAPHRDAAPYIVSLWSLSCPPCLAEMPVWRRLRAAHPGLDLVLIATDRLDDEAPRLLHVLEKHGLGGAKGGVDAWAFADGFVERLRHEIDPGWRGALPRTILVGADGSRRVIAGLIGADEIEGWLAAQGVADRARP